MKIKRNKILMNNMASTLYIRENSGSSKASQHRSPVEMVTVRNQELLPTHRSMVEGELSLNAWHLFEMVSTPITDLMALITCLKVMVCYIRFRYQILVKLPSVVSMWKLISIFPIVLTGFYTIGRVINGQIDPMKGFG